MEPSNGILKVKLIEILVNHPPLPFTRTNHRDGTRRTTRSLENNSIKVNSFFSAC